MVLKHLALMVNILTIESPCVKICKIEEIDGVKTCIGCDRTLEQIRDWSKYTDEERHAIMCGSRSIPSSINNPLTPDPKK